MITPVMPTYGRWDVAVDHGEGCWLYAEDGRKFLDFTSGIAVTGLGHCHPHLVDALRQQAGRLWHSSNLFRIPGQERLAQRLVDNTFADTVFFGNSGAEACELALKIARKYQHDTGHPERYRIIGCDGSFHGRTFATLAAAGNEKYLEGFGPPMDGFDHVAFSNLNEMRAAVGGQTAAIFVEPVQGEGGVRPADLRFLRDLRTACDEHGIILGLDEVQSGMGRTGKLFAYEWAGIEPDVMSAAKGIAGGFPLGAILAKEHVAKYLVPGTHGTTFGGNPLACAAGNAVLDVMLAPGFLESVERKGRYLWDACSKIARDFPEVFADVRGAGLLLGMKCVLPQGEVQAACVAEGLLALTAGDNVLRLVPPLVLTDEDCAEGMAMLRRAAQRCLPSTAKVAAK